MEDDVNYMDYDETYYDIYPDYGDEYLTEAAYTLYDLWQDCLLPVLTDGFSSSVVLFTCCIILKLATFLNFQPNYTYHLTSLLSGLYCLHNLFGKNFLYIVAFAAIGYGVLLIASKLGRGKQGVICVIFCFMFLISCETLIVEKTIWHQIRGSQMVLTMKLISLAFDSDTKEKEIPGLLCGFGYLFHVGTVIFGPWISYSSYLTALSNKRLAPSVLIRIIKCLALSFGFLTVSSCWTSWFFHSTQWKWLGAYRDAASFRTSHYFICYLSEAATLTSGVGLNRVVSSLDVEVPRSLVEVVVSWNFPMHFWLKTYVFKTARPLGDFAAVLSTYVASSLLHGLNFQLAAVLLSLGFYTYIEHVLRKKLAAAFSACILARQCKPGCAHCFQQDEPLVKLTNLAFGSLTVFHLAYLGLMFDSASALEEQGYSMSHTLEKWSHLNFASHWVAAFSYAFYYLI